MTPDEIAKHIPDALVEAIARDAWDTEYPTSWELSMSRKIIAAGLAAWPGMVWHPEGQQRKHHGVTHIILPLKETQNEA